MSETHAGPPALGDSALLAIDARLAAADRDLARRYPGQRPGPQPIHTVYLPADRMKPGIAKAWGRTARSVLDEHAADPESFATATGFGLDVTAEVWPLVLAKLDGEPIEDLRVDFEDGYGNRSDDEEDAAARGAVAVITVDLARRSPPRWIGLRIKSLEVSTRRRGLRTLELVVGGLVAAGGLPDGFKITLPKVTSVDQVEAMVDVCGRLETAYDLPARRLSFEIQIETPQSILGANGSAAVARMIHASDRRCDGLHFGTYDYTAALGISAAQQRLDHPAADHAKDVLQVAAAGTGVPVSDGSSNVLPVGDRTAVHAAWALHARLVTRALERGIYQGWDLHPAQLPTRYLATFAFFRSGLPGAQQRLTDYLGRRTTGVLDEPATAQALASFVLRAIDCGAAISAEVGLGRHQLERLVSRRPG